ncbi:hypothetical protein [Photobacterium phosphoreum]|uniref:hypothetical protein n=1 Tax=Photobacterium phosphoreum TaxID=659 RepID=UPI0024B73E79|nr:hypothetical protein [Photobacterium phosphoreum]
MPVNKNELIQQVLANVDQGYQTTTTQHEEELNHFSAEAQQEQEIMNSLLEDVNNLDEMLEELEEMIDLVDESTAEESQLKINMIKLIQVLGNTIDRFTVAFTIIAEQSENQDKYLGVYQKALLLLTDQFDLPEDPNIAKAIIERVLAGEDLQTVVSELTKTAIAEELTPPDELPKEETATPMNSTLTAQDQARQLLDEELNQK